MLINVKKHLFFPLLSLSVLVASALACPVGSGPSIAEPPPTDTPTTVPVPSELPDFAIVGYWREPAESLVVQPNTPVYYHIQVTNQGNASYTGFVLVGGPGSGGFNDLMPGQTKEAFVEFLVYLPDYGGKASDIYFTVDPDNIITEADETNNTLGPLTVIYGGG